MNDIRKNKAEASQLYPLRSHLQRDPVRTNFGCNGSKTLFTDIP
jgi:hypothetical protein